MAGIFDRMQHGVEDRIDTVATHLLGSALKLYSNANVTRQQILDAINETLVTPLDAAAQADLTGMADIIDGFPANATGRANLALYSSAAAEVFIQYEKGITAMTETNARTILGI